jgi:Arrestin (or S-antigen), N-terminal domain
MVAGLLIAIADRKPVYTAGDIIKGQVILHSGKDEAIGRVAICFTGRGKTKLLRSNGNNRRVYRGRAPLFRQLLVLYQNHYTHKAGQYAWDFEFIIPALTDPNLRENTWAADGSVWVRTGVAHELPPTFKYYDNHCRNQGMVEYKLEAEMLRHNPSIFDSKVEAAQEITYMPPQPAGDLEYRMFLREERFEARTLHLLPDKAQKELTFKEKIHTLFHHDRLPSVVFKVRLVYPTYTYPRRPIPIKLAVVSMETSSNLPAPEVMLHSLSVKISSSYDFRAYGFWDNQGHTGRDYTLLNLPKITPVAVPQNPGTSAQPAAQSYSTALYGDLPDGERYIDLSSWRVDGLATPLLCPSFSTVNIAVQHALRVKFRLMCAGKDFVFDHAQDLRVWSPPRSGGPALTGRAAQAAQAGPAVASPVSVAGSRSGPVSPLEGDVQLPTYSPTLERGAQLLDSGASRPPAYVRRQEISSTM